jgi:hypothetical protein
LWRRDGRELQGSPTRCTACLSRGYARTHVKFSVAQSSLFCLQTEEMGGERQGAQTVSDVGYMGNGNKAHRDEQTHTHACARAHAHSRYTSDKRGRESLSEAERLQLGQVVQRLGYRLRKARSITRTTRHTQGHRCDGGAHRLWVRLPSKARRRVDSAQLRVRTANTARAAASGAAALNPTTACLSLARAHRKYIGRPGREADGWEGTAHTGMRGVGTKSNRQRENDEGEGPSKGDSE